MKLTFLLMCGFVFSLSATVRAQDQMVTLKAEKMSFVKVISELKRQTRLNFFYSFNEVDINQKISLDVKNEKIDEVLRLMFGDRFKWEYVDDMVIIKPATVNVHDKKPVRVKGFVYDTKKEPMPGVTVKIVGLPLGTATNEKGWFALDLPLLKGALEFSFVGFKKKQVEFTEKTDTLRIVLEEDMSDIDEVVVRAYGTQKKREVVSAMSSVTAEEMKELPAASITSMLQGRLAGVNIIQQSGAPGSAAVVAVRGFNSLMVKNGASDGQPLWVVDGVPMHSFVSPVTGTNTLADLDPSMIESVQVLKDAAAASIYGSRAGNGVILVTTKKGKEGRAQFSANVSYTISQLMEYPEQTGGRMERWMNLQIKRNQKEKYYKNGAYYFPTSYEDIFKQSSGNYDQFWAKGDASSAKVEPTLQDSLDPYYNNSTNWWKHVFNTGKVLNANIQASGGSERIRYMVGLGFYDEDGIMLNSGYSRANLMSNLSAQFTSKLRLDTRVYLSYVDRTMNKSGADTRFEGIAANPMTQSTIISVSKELEDEWLKRMKGMKDRTDDYRAMVSAFLEYKLMDGLSVSASGNVDFSQGNMNMFSPSSLDMSYHENKSQGAISRQVMLSTEELLNYNKSIKEKHNISVLLGFNANKEQNFYIGGWGKKGASDDVYYYDPEKTKDVVDHGTAQSPRPESTRSYKSDFTEKAMVSLFGRFSYNYKQRYLMEFTLRRDGSSTFGEGNRWANFPSIALGWTFSEESFIKRWTGSWLNWGKIRGSYGTSGQIFTEAYLAHGLMTVESATFLGSSGVTSARPISPDLTWEKTEQYDLGLDLDMFDYRLNLKLDYYYKRTSSLIYGVDLPGGLSPFSTRTENSMAVSNEGIELELQADILRQSAVSWRMKLNASRNWNRFEDSYTGKDVAGWVIGRPLNGLYVYAHDGFYESEDEVPHYYKTNGDDTFWGGVTAKTGVSGQVGNYILRDLNDDKNPSAYYAGSTLPLMHGGWINEVMWKNFDLNVLVNYTIGRKMINARVANSFDPVNGITKMLDYRDLNFWEKPGDHANMPAWGNKVEYLLNTNIEKVHSVSLKQLTVGYNLPKQLAAKTGFSGVRFFTTVENLFYLSNYSAENPEVIDVYKGIDDGKSYPLPRKWTLGLTLNF